MTRKRIDASGKVVDDAEAPPPAPSGVVGTIGQSPTPTAETPPASLGLWAEMLLLLAVLHIRVAHFVRRSVLLIPDVDLDVLQRNQEVIAQQHLVMSQMVSEVRGRLGYHEANVPLLGRSRAQYDAQKAVKEAGYDRKSLRQASAPPDGPQAG